MGKLNALPDGSRAERTSALSAGQSTEVTAEEVSLLVDGELDADRVERVCYGLRASSALETWTCYHVIGDALRGHATPLAGFAARFSARLDAEPTILAPQRRRPAPLSVALAIAATVAAVGVVGWVALTTMPAPNEAIATAQQASALRPDGRRPVVNEYLLAHQEYSPATAIAGVRPYLRAVAADDQDASH